MIAEPIRKMPLAASFAAGRSSLLQRKSGRASAHRETSTQAPPIVNEVLRSPGQPLDSGTRAFMEPRFGCNFADVQVHPDAKAADSADAVNAHAYTVGRHLVFGRGQYAPGSPAGQRLLAHELTHVVQQSGRQSGGSLQVAPAKDQAEGAADRAADQVLAGAHGQAQVSPPSSGGEVLQRQPKEPETKKEGTPDPSGPDKTPASPSAASNKCPPFPAPGFEAVVSTEALGSPVGDVFNAGDGDLTVGVGEAFDLSYHSVAGADRHKNPPPEFFGGLHWVKRGSGTLNADETSGAGKWKAPETPGDVTLVIRTVAQNCEMARVKIHVVDPTKEKQPKAKPSHGRAPEPEDPPNAPFSDTVAWNYIGSALGKHKVIWDAYQYLWGLRNAPHSLKTEPDMCSDPSLAAAEHYLYARTLVQDFGFPSSPVAGGTILYGTVKDLMRNHGLDLQLGRCPTTPNSDEQVKFGKWGAMDGSDFNLENLSYCAFGWCGKDNPRYDFSDQEK